MVEDRKRTQRHLILGGARSGKTAHALATANSLALQNAANVTYVATAQPLDAEMEHRISLHRAERPLTWRTLEAPAALAQALDPLTDAEIIIVDCMTLWLSNALLKDFRDDQATAALPAWDSECAAFISWLQRTRADVLLISNEVGSGIVPLSALSRRFQDEQGRLNQLLAAQCERVTLVVAGIPLSIKA